MKSFLQYVVHLPLFVILFHSATSCTYQFQGINPESLPYIEQAIALMRNNIGAKMSARAASKGLASKEIQVQPNKPPLNRRSGRTNQVNQVIHLTQRDFDSGTYRIRTPNTTIILDTDIEFDPIPAAEAKRTDKPIIGWFAAITVETDNVIIDLNCKKLQASEAFLAADAENVFADIELDNAPFSGLLFGLLGAFFPGDTEFVSAQNVVIKNGTLARTDHWCIHGNNNSNVTVNNVHIKDFPVAGIELNGVINSTISDVKVTGLEHLIRTSFIGVAASTLINYLTVIANEPDEPCFDGASEQLAALTAYVAANPQIFNTPLVFPQGAMVGLEVASGFLNFVTFPANPDDCAFAAILSGGGTVENVTFENISIDGLANSPQESVLIASQADGTILNLPLFGIPVFGALTWDSAFDEEGNFNPTPLLQAQIFVINTQLCLFPDIIGAILPANYAAIADSIMTGNEVEFLTNVFPVFGIALDSVQIKGAFGVRFDCSSNGTVKNVKTSNIRNLGVPGQTLATIPDGNFYVGLVQETRYLGNDCWGFEFSTQADGLVKDCHSCKISSLHGDVFGLDLIESNETTLVDSCTSTKIVGFGDDVGSIVNPPATAYGFRVQNNSGPIEFSNSFAKKITAPRNAFGFAAEETQDVLLSHCNVEQVSATSSKDLAISPKQAFGFDLQGAHNTFLECVSAQKISIEGEEGASVSASVAAGIGIDSESADTTIICPTLCKIKGGAGQAKKIYDLGLNTIVITGKECEQFCNPCTN